VEDLEIPQSVRGAILSRVEKLPEPAREAMRMASILGREFEFDVLRRASDLPEDQLIGALEDAERAQLISATRRNGDIAFSFAHALIPASLSESVSVLRRKSLHRRAALAIEAVRPDAWEVLAYHWIEAGDDEQARTASLRAGDRAYASLARAEAVRHYRAALERWPEDDRAGRAEVLAKLGDCLLVAAAGDVSDIYREARDLYRDLGDIVHVGEMERRLGRFYYEAGDRERSMQHYQQALKILEACPPTPELAMAFSSMSQMLMLSSEYQEALRWGERAIALAAELDAEAVRVHALNNVGCSWVGLGQTDKGLALLQESFDRAVAAGLPHDAARATMNQGDIFLNLARFAEAGRAYGELIDFAGRYHVHGFESSARERLVLTHWLMGEWDVALEVEQNLRDTGALPAGLTQVWHDATNGLIYNDLGRPEEARQLLETQLEDALRNDELQTTIPFLTQLARACALLGQPEAGRDAVEGMLQRMDAIPFFDGSCGPGLAEIVYWIEAAEGQSGAVLGAACLERLQRMVTQVRPIDAAPMLDEVGAVVALMRRDPQTAAALFAAAGAGWESLHRPYPCARASAGQARALAAGGQGEQAYAALRRARAILEGLRAKLADDGLRESFTNNGLLAGVLSALASAGES
jgi:tetratricopeptide (TPR) repeat protein